jgi:RNA polymerase sigma-70 factor (ECF subfamily)
MSELDREAQRLLELAREARTPSASDRARVRARLSSVAGIAVTADLTADAGLDSSAGAGPGAGAGADAGSGVGAASVAGLKGWLGSAAGAWILAGVCAASAMVGGLAVVATLDRGVAEGAPVAPAPVAAPEHRQRASDEGARKDEPAAPVPPSAAVAPEPPVVPAAQVESPQRPSRRPSRAGGADPLVAELKMLHRARALWRRGEAADALSLLQRHRGRYPDSALSVERDALRVLCLCDLGRAGQARRLGRRWLGAASDSPLRAAVAQSCAVE